MKTWALVWLRRIRLLYRLNDRRLAVQQDARRSRKPTLCQAVSAMTTQMETELPRPDLATPAGKYRKLRVLWERLRRFVDDPRISMDNNISERLERAPAWSVELLGSGSLWSVHYGGVVPILAPLAVKLYPWKWLTWYFEHCAAAGGRVPTPSNRSYHGT